MSVHRHRGFDNARLFFSVFLLVDARCFWQAAILNSLMISFVLCSVFTISSLRSLTFDSIYSFARRDLVCIFFFSVNLSNWKITYKTDTNNINVEKFEENKNSQKFVIFAISISVGPSHIFVCFRFRWAEAVSCNTFICCFIRMQFLFTAPSNSSYPLVFFSPPYYISAQLSMYAHNIIMEIVFGVCFASPSLSFSLSLYITRMISMSVRLWSFSFLSSKTSHSVGRSVCLVAVLCVCVCDCYLLFPTAAATATAVDDAIIVAFA